ASLGLTHSVASVTHRGAGQPLGPFEDGREAVWEGSVAVAAEKLQKATLASANGSDLRAKIAHGARGQAHIGANDRCQLRVLTSRFVDLHERQLDPFGVNVSGNAAEHAADIRPVGHG